MIFFALPVFSALPEGGEDLDSYIASLASGDQSALEQIYRQTHGAVYGFALSLCKNAQDAEDVLQEVYIQAYQGAGSYASQGKPMAWLLTITRNLALMCLREKKRVVAMSPEDWQTQFADRAAFTEEDRLLLEGLLSRLGDEERQIVMLHAVAGLKHREIAQLLELPLATVLSKYSRSLKKLRNLFMEVQ